MVVKNQFGFSLLALMRLREDQRAPETARGLFLGPLFDAPSHDSGSVQLAERKATHWAEGGSVIPMFFDWPEAGGEYIDLHVFWHDKPGPFLSGLPAPPGGGVLGLAAKEKHVSRKTRPIRLEWVVGRAIAVFDCLQADWGCLDTFDALRIGTDYDPRTDPRWMTFLGPGSAAQVDALKGAGARVETRPWGGYVVTAWESPFQPPKASQTTRLKEALGGTPNLGR